MKKLLALFPAAVLCAGGLVFAPAAAFAQAPAAAGGKEELVKIKDVKVEVQKEPKFQAEGPKDKHWKPKDWLEIEVECEAVYSKTSKDKKQTTYPEVTFKYYVYLEGASKEKSRVLTGEVVHTNVPIKEVSHSSMYIHPDTFLEISGKPEGAPNLVKAWGVIVTIGGETVGYKVSPGAAGTAEKPWWDNPALPAKQPGLKNKAESPFAILWGSYHLGIKAK